MILFFTIFGYFMFASFFFSFGWMMRALMCESDKALTRRLYRLEQKRSGLQERKRLIDDMFKTCGKMTLQEHRELLDVGQEIARLNSEVSQVKFELDDKIMSTMGVAMPKKENK